MSWRRTPITHLNGLSMIFSTRAHTHKHIAHISSSRSQRCTYTPSSDVRPHRIGRIHFVVFGVVHVSIFGCHVLAECSPERERKTHPGRSERRRRRKKEDMEKTKRIHSWNEMWLDWMRFDRVFSREAHHPRRRRRHHRQFGAHSAQRQNNHLPWNVCTNQTSQPVNNSCSSSSSAGTTKLHMYFKCCPLLVRSFIRSSRLATPVENVYIFFFVFQRQDREKGMVLVQHWWTVFDPKLNVFVFFSSVADMFCC